MGRPMSHTDAHTHTYRGHNVVVVNRYTLYRVNLANVRRADGLPWFTVTADPTFDLPAYDVYEVAAEVRHDGKLVPPTF